MQVKIISKNEPLLILRIGLAVVFISNGLMPFLTPDDYSNLVGRSFLGQILPVSVQTFGIFTGINDVAVATLLIVGARVKYVAGYACFWIIGVMSVYGITQYLDVLEHVGFLSMAAYLVVQNRKTAFQKHTVAFKNEKKLGDEKMPIDPNFLEPPRDRHMKKC